MISLAKYLRPPADADHSAWQRAISLLVQGMQLHTLDCNKDEFARFRSELTALDQRLTPEISVPELFVLVGEIIQTFELYNRRAMGTLRAQFSELQSIIDTFTSAMAAMVSASDASLKRLGEIRSQLGSAESIADLRLLKGHLCECLNGMASEVAEHRRSSAAHMQKLAAGALEFTQSIEANRALDAITGLPTRAEADSAMARLADAGASATAIIFVLPRLKQVNARFGYEAGDGLLQRLSTHLKAGADSEKWLYRWSGPSLLALFTRHQPADHIRQEVARLVGGIPGFEFNTGARTAIIPISVAWALFPVTAPIERLIGQIDVFVSNQEGSGAPAPHGLPEGIASTTETFPASRTLAS